MVYHCDRCGAALGRGVTVCAKCGRRFELPVPLDADMPGTEATPEGIDALLRGRQASGPGAGLGQLPSQPPAEGGPAWYGQTASKRRAGGRRGLWLALGIGLAAMLGLAGWGGSVLWMKGPGGDMAFHQHNLLGNTASERGDFQTADEEYSQMIALRPSRVEGYLLRGISEYKEGQYGLSIRDNTAALALTHSPLIQGNLLYNRAEGYASRGKLPQAIADYTQAMSLYGQVNDRFAQSRFPDRIEDVYRSRAEVYWQHKDYRLAIADCNTLIGKSHPRPQDYGVRAKAEAGLGQTEAALSDFQHALSLDPSYLAGYDGLAELADKHHLYAQAVAAYEAGVRAEPSSTHLWGSLGWFQYASGHTPQAIQTDLHSLSLDPNQAWVLYNLGLCYAVGGDRARAQAAYAVALAHGSKTEQQSGLTDLIHALAAQPKSVALQQARQQVARGPVAGDRSVRLSIPAPTVSAAPPVDPAFVSQLGPEVTVGDYRFRPPLGYTLTQRPEAFLDGNGTVFLWSGPRRDDGTTPDIQIRIDEDDGRMAAHATSAQEARIFLDSMGDNHSQLVQSTVTTSPVNGLPFVQGTWSGVGQQTGKTYEGIVYVLVAPSKYIEIQSHDAAPFSHTTLPLLRALYADIPPALTQRDDLVTIAWENLIR